MHVSAIVCTHNPRKEFLNRTLSHLRRQSLSVDCWELLVVDNRSSESVSSWIDLTWHPRARVVCEESIGLTNARLRGIIEASSDVLVFIDDDNLLCDEYLTIALDIASQWPQLGAWGGGISPEYEAVPEPALEPYYPYLALRPVARDRWGNGRHMDATPYGAGMVVRRSVATRYAALVRTDPIRRHLGRRGQSLVSCEDIDLAWASIDLGLGIGVFSTLHLTHLIPASRMSPGYLLRLVEAVTASHVVLDTLHGLPVAPRYRSPFRRAIDEVRLFRKTAVERQFVRARQRGLRRGWHMVDELFTRNSE